MYTDPKRARFWGQLWHRDGRAFADLLTADLADQAARRAAAPTEEAFCQTRGRVPWTSWLALSELLAQRFADTHDPAAALAALPPAVLGRRHPGLAQLARLGRRLRQCRQGRRPPPDAG